MAVSAAVTTQLPWKLCAIFWEQLIKIPVWFCAGFSRPGYPRCVEQIDQLIRAGHEAQVFLREMTRHLRALLTVKVVEGSAASLLQITEEDEQRYRTQAALFSQERLIRIMNNFMTADSELRFASAPRIGLEIAALKACQNVTGEDVAAVNRTTCGVGNQVTRITESNDTARSHRSKTE